MGLSDIYFQKPYAPAQQTLEQVNQIGPAMAEQRSQDMQQQSLKMQKERQDLENERMRQDMPNAPASPHGQAIGGWIKQHLENHAAASGAPPGSADRLLGELQSPAQAPPGLGAVQGPQAPAPAQNLGPTGRYDFTGKPWPTPQQQPFGPPQAQMPQVSSSGGLGVGMGAPPPPQTPGPQMPAQGGRQPLPASSAYAADRNAPPPAQAPGAGMTNRDVEQYMRMAPWAKLDQAPKEDPRLTISREKLVYQREQLAQREKAQARSDQTRRDLATISAQLRQSPGDKMLIERLKEAGRNHRDALDNEARIRGGLFGIIDEPGTRAELYQEEARAIQEKTHLDQLDALAAAPERRGASASTKGPRTGQQRIPVIDKKTGTPGTIDANEWDPNLYDKR